MSYDIIILKPMELGTDDLTNVDEVLEIGDEASVLRSLEQVLPGCIHGVFAKDDSFTIEGSLSGKPVTFHPFITQIRHLLVRLILQCISGAIVRTLRFPSDSRIFGV
ncbi:hypothetical protein [Pseudomonas petrae]|uniref:Uncharacterized protein n=1 Tax=Pseudomonas petrae TaxID=2912190 RepID=A0ABS9I548_9PSED|nr:hypothetical protein [Pseudomonas petrae]MCF7530685.1 hypothetical protein [Pseudomonas petrae]MCF7536359.1 hypothetical protein [Pseudomonas petrae]MCF7542900.1 hypothetical protein [Pseudomonas petrae]MCF7554037.1 hypothetical protein [Pseudomonas petrae]